MTHPFKQYMVSYDEGERIYAQGDRGASMFIVHSGAVRLSRGEGEEATALGVMEKGDFFGEMAILEGGPRGHTAEAEEATELIEINASTFDAMIRRNLEIAIRMMRKLSHRLRKAEQRVATSPPPVMAEPVATAEAAVPPEPTPAPSAPVAETPAPPLPPTAALMARLMAEDGSRIFDLASEEALVGRYDPVTEIQPEVDLTEIDLKRSVSRRHARIVLREGEYFVVEEVGALNGTFLNGVKLVTGKPTSIQDGDTLSMGMVRLVFQCGPPA